MLAHADTIDHFVLCDSSIVLDIDGGHRVVIDDRTARLPAYDAGTVAQLRNAPGGFWAASTSPVAAQHALTGSTPLPDVRRAAVLTDGAARLVERFGRSWQDAFTILDAAGPRGVLDALRAAEQAGQPVTPGHRDKQFDDGTLALCEFRASTAASVAAFNTRKSTRYPRQPRLAASNNAF
ncbi:protein phosphatase 2C domain-containing protein [Micromonospora sp. NPDC003197]